MPYLKAGLSNPKSSLSYLYYKVMRDRPLYKFIRRLTRIKDEEIRMQLNQMNGSKFEDDIRRKLMDYPLMGGLTYTHGRLPYLICKLLKPNLVVETGVLSCISSAYILRALNENNKGKLYSIDNPDELLLSYGKEPGFVIPNELRHRWRLISGKSSEQLLPLLNDIDNIDMFFHDSDHSYRNMMFEFETAYPHLNLGGIILSDNLETNSSFHDFCDKRGIDFVTVRYGTSVFGAAQRSY